MDPLSLAFAFITAFAAGRAVQEAQALGKSRREELQRVWGEYLSARMADSAASKVDATHPLRSEAAVLYDRMQEEGELPPGYTWVRETPFPVAARESDVLTHKSAAWDPTFQEMVIGSGEVIAAGQYADMDDDDDRIAETISRDYVEPYLGRVIWVYQLSGHNDNGGWETVVLDEPVRVRFPERIVASDRIMMEWNGEYFDARPEIVVDVIDWDPALSPLLGAQYEYRTTMRPVYYTGWVIEGELYHDTYEMDDEDEESLEDGEE